MVQVQIIAAAHYQETGARGRRGGADQHDKLWGLAKVGGTTVRFWGRRNGRLKFKTEINGAPHDVMRQKLSKGYQALGPRAIEALCPTLARDIPSDFFSAMSRGQLNTRH